MLRDRERALAFAVAERNADRARCHGPGVRPRVCSGPWIFSATRPVSRCWGPSPHRDGEGVQPAMPLDPRTVWGWRQGDREGCREIFFAC